MVFIHENNLKTKIGNNYKKIGEKIEEIYETEYLPVKNKLLSITFNNDEECFKKASIIIDEYLMKLKEYEEKFNIDARSKFRSSFLEEISTYLFKDNKHIIEEELGIYNKGIYSGLKLDSNRNIRLLKKDVDFCIGKKCALEIDRKSTEEIIVPILAVEVKTYLDGTMLGEVQYSSKLIKNATPNAKTYVLMETNEVGEDKIISARYDKALDEMFVLKKDSHSPIDSRVLLDYYNEIENAINNTLTEDVVNVPGRLINIVKNNS